MRRGLCEWVEALTGPARMIMGEKKQAISHSIRTQKENVENNKPSNYFGSDRIGMSHTTFFRGRGRLWV